VTMASPVRHHGLQHFRQDARGGVLACLSPQDKSVEIGSSLGTRHLDEIRRFAGICPGFFTLQEAVSRGKTSFSPVGRIPRIEGLTQLPHSATA
jgi:hypothetical protein